MAERKNVYLLKEYRQSSDGAWVGLVIADDTTKEEVQSEWLTVLERTYARNVLNPEDYPDLVVFHSAAIDELQERNPTWEVIFAYFLGASGLKPAINKSGAGVQNIKEDSIKWF